MRTIHKIITIILTLGVLFPYNTPLSFAAAYFRPETPPAIQINVPQEVRKIIPEQDLITLLSYEAKAKGGEAIARIEALEEILTPLLNKVRELGVDVKTPDYQTLAKQLKDKLNAIGNQPTLESAEKKLQEFITLAQQIQERNIGSDLRSQIEPILKAKGEEIRARLEKELRKEGEQLGKEARARLQAQAEQEVKEIKARLQKQLKREIEKELKARFAGQKNIDMDYVKKLGKEMAEEKARKAAKKAKTELQRKYEQLAQQERERITKIMEKKADEIGGEEKRKLEEIRDGFLNLKSNLDKLTEQKMGQWLEFKKKAIDKKKEILIKIIGDKIEQAKELILSHKQEIDEARNNGAQIPSAEELVAELEQDKENFLNQLSSQQLDEATIKNAVAQFKSKWDKIRLDLEQTQAQSAAQVYRVLAEKLQKNGFSKQRISSLELSSLEAHKFLHQYEQWRKWCHLARSYNEKYINPRYRGVAELWRDQVCYGGGYYGFRFNRQGKMVQPDPALFQEVAKAEEQAYNKLKEFLQYNENSDLQDLLKYKEELVTALNHYRETANRLKAQCPGIKIFYSYIKAITYGI